ncbi:MAG TPA: 23S rRNA (adenine(2030)-N(6))-methyltransferase RlmJ [Azospira sp.]|nr:23S rRNA (adenine(2030)-N(6))-methyltransferase RlmJ [Azospira sp.]HNN07958.1 23S rRNA (adenine(2030)-N(6))-methyltransferase RlmJ [Azospira sp.]HNN44610.1 23S rRNA (adenine(2030)-N(6))-methyltransferase RlmJ [Azospira sp.]
MLSYRHSFHAGNHADVLKHLVLVQLIDYLKQKDKPFWVVDTHAGAGLYALDAGHATQLSEHEGGIARLWARADLPPAVAAYVEAVRPLNPKGTLTAYPGSPWIAFQRLRADDRLRLFELHSTDVATLADNFREAGRQVMVTHGDGLAGLKALLPPPPRRALTLIDPSYEVAGDYRGVVKTLAEALARFPTGTYAVWYPILAKPEARSLPEKLRALGARSWLDVTLTVRKQPPGTFGMPGSGMFVINPPWTLEKTLNETMPWLVDALGEDEGAAFTLASLAN